MPWWAWFAGYFGIGVVYGLMTCWYYHKKLVSFLAAIPLWPVHLVGWLVLRVFKLRCGKY